MKAKTIIFAVVLIALGGGAWWSMRRSELASQERHLAIDLAWEWFHDLSGSDADRALARSSVPFDWNGREQVSDRPRLEALLRRNFSASGPALTAWQMPASGLAVQFSYAESFDPEVKKIAPSGAIAVNIDQDNADATDPVHRRCLVMVRLGSDPKVVGFRDLSAQH